MRHTPGPWMLGGKDTVLFSCGAFVVFARNKHIVAAANPHIQTAANAEDEANARLIAAAPEMLEALKNIQEWLLDTGGPIDRPDLWHPAFLKARSATEAVIAKATGGAQ